MSKINKLYLWLAGVDFKKIAILIILVKLATCEDTDGPPTSP